MAALPATTTVRRSSPRLEPETHRERPSRRETLCDRRSSEAGHPPPSTRGVRRQLRPSRATGTHAEAQSRRAAYRGLPILGRAQQRSSAWFDVRRSGGGPLDCHASPCSKRYIDPPKHPLRVERLRHRNRPQAEAHAPLPFAASMTGRIPYPDHEASIPLLVQHSSQRRQAQRSARRHSQAATSPEAGSRARPVHSQRAPT